MVEFFEQFLSKISEDLRTNLPFAIVDVVLVAALFFALFVFLRKYNATRLIKYVLMLIFAALILSSPALNLRIIGNVLSFSTILVAIFVIIIFPQEIRRSLYRIASPKEMHENFNTKFDCSDEELHATVTNIVQGVQNMAKKNVGALLIIANEDMPTHILESGTRLDSIISVQILESIFNTKSPIHDGAVFIKGNRIMSAGCFLPLSQSIEIDKELGTRHRAAIGVSEAYNVLSVIVSEESGVISTAYKGEIVRYYDSEMLTDILEQVYGLKATAESLKKRKREKKHGIY